ncbi:transposase, IS5 family [Opitutaceae bacterium TAV1]|nr:transposase, IS5 family [Opitutaceae bacterium TAV1]
MSNLQTTFFGEHGALESLMQAGDRLVELDRQIEWEPLVKVVEGIWRGGRKKAGSGAKPWDSEVMLRVMVLKRLYNLSDEQTEYQIRDRLSFMRFVKLGLTDAVPDRVTIWLYSDVLAKADGARKLFAAFDEQLARRGLLVKEGVIVDATFVEVPRQRNSREDNAKIKEGRQPEAWSQQPRKLAHKDTDARWTVKNHQTYYGYKDHVKIAIGTKLIRDWAVTPANIHDSQPMPGLIKKTDGDAYGDSAYAGQTIARDLQDKGVGNHLHEKGARSVTLDENQKAANRDKSKIRARIEHAFAFMEKSLGGIYNRCVGLLRNSHQIGMMNFCYNLCRFAQIVSGRTSLPA